MENKMVNKGIEYMCVGDCYIPDLKLPNEDHSLRKYGQMHRDYLRKKNLILLDHLILEGCSGHILPI